MADITEKRVVSGDIVGVINKLKYKDEPITIQGSAKLADQQTTIRSKNIRRNP
jgi:hypothetical protein